MAQVKDYMKVLITALITTLITLTLSGAFEKNAKLNNAASKSELSKGMDKVKKESINYTDLKIDEHEKHHLYISTEIKDIKESNIRVEDKLDKILFKMANL